jgi:hypothetical protein
MATETQSEDHLAVITAFLEGDAEEFDELGEPPLADQRDPLLDGDRLHLAGEENNEASETGDE